MDPFEDETVDSLGTTVDDLVAIGRLLDSPRLAHIWFTLQVEGNLITEGTDRNSFAWKGLTVSELSEHLSGEVPQSTLYSDMDELEEIGAVRIRTDGQPTGYSARFFQAEAENIDEVGEAGLVGPQIIGLVGEAFTDKAVQHFLETHGQGSLNDALQIYTASLRGSLNQDFVEIFPDVDSNELEAIVPAIERVLLEMSRDPLWGGDYRSDLAIEDGGTDT
jgi:DNA-binding transcriptional ArsR family regulator